MPGPISRFVTVYVGRTSISCRHYKLILMSIHVLYFKILFGLHPCFIVECIARNMLRFGRYGNGGTSCRGGDSVSQFYKYTALSWAARNGHTDCLRLLIKARARTDDTGYENKVRNLG